MAKPTTIGQLIDQLERIRIKYRAQSEIANRLKAEYDDLEQIIEARLFEEGMDKATGKTATVSIKRSIVGTIKDWDALTAFVKKTGYFHLFNHSVGAPAFRELYEQEMAKVKPGKTEEITAERRQAAEQKFTAHTGLAPFTKIGLNHSSIKQAA